MEYFENSFTADELKVWATQCKRNTPKLEWNRGGQGRPKAPPATQNASQKSLGGTKIRKLGGGKIYLSVLREN